MIQKQGNWVLYELKPRNIERRFSHVKCCLPGINEEFFASYTGDEKWIHYDNPKKRKS